MAERTWLEAAAVVLRQAPEPMHYKAIAEAIGMQRLKSALGAKPANSVYSTIYGNIRQGDSDFELVGQGLFRLKGGEQLAPVQESAEDAVVETGAIRAFGMFWQRAAVVWTSKPKLLGRQQKGAAKVDFSEQVGVYLLHDRDRVIYVGRAAERSLGQRLRAHTDDRLSGRWDRFSWFGLRNVSDDGTVLRDAEVVWNYDTVVNTLEAVLIESLEPPLNRRQGDGFAATEYLQAEDPSFAQKQKKALLSEVAEKLGIIE